MLLLLNTGGQRAMHISPSSVGSRATQGVRKCVNQFSSAVSILFQIFEHLSPNVNKSVSINC